MVDSFFDVQKPIVRHVEDLKNKRKVPEYAAVRRYVVHNLVGYLSVLSEHGAPQYMVIRAFTAYRLKEEKGLQLSQLDLCKECKNERIKGTEKICRDILTELVKAGLIGRTEIKTEKSKKRGNQKEVYYQDHLWTLVNTAVIKEERIKEALVQVRRRNWELGMRVANLEMFLIEQERLNGRGLWSEFFEWYEKRKGSRYPKISLDKLGFFNSDETW